MTAYAMVPNKAVCEAMGWSDAESHRVDPKSATNKNWVISYRVGSERHTTTPRPLPQHNAFVEGLTMCAAWTTRPRVSIPESPPSETKPEEGSVT